LWREFFVVPAKTSVDLLWEEVWGSTRFNPPGKMIVSNRKRKSRKILYLLPYGTSLKGTSLKPKVVKFHAQPGTTMLSWKGY
jgi:hypothetical protein